MGGGVADSVYDMAVAKGWKISELDIRRPSLEEVFMKVVMGDEAALAG